MKRFAIVLFTVLATAAASAQDQTTITQQLLRTGSFERVVVGPYEPLQLADLVGKSDLIVEASTVGGRTSFSDDGADVQTDFAFRVHSIIKNAATPELRLGSLVTVRRNSGTMVVGGRAAVVIENDFPLFERDQHYVLFLSHPADSKFYSVVGGPQGAFALGEGTKQMAMELGDWSNKHGAVPAATFMDEVRALLKYSSF